jgi:tRNA dimethylallyltransferase
MPRPILIAGPTASGKSALALALADLAGGAVVNADSQQVYEGWRLVTARPCAGETARAPHRLFGHVPLGTPYSVGEWLRDLEPVLAECAEAGWTPVIVGGTGLYFKALTEGIAPIPAVPAAVRARAEAMLEEMGLASAAARLADRDPETAAAIDRQNPRRVLRALEVLEATGTGLAAWRRRTTPPLVPPGRARRLLLDPPRPALAGRIERRLDAMVAEGALDEAAAVMARGLPPDAPGMKAVGAPELMAHLAGETTLAEAMDRARAATRRYAKRQMTWMRNQMPDWPRIWEPTAEARLAVARALIGL